MKTVYCHELIGGWIHKWNGALIDCAMCHDHHHHTSMTYVTHHFVVQVVALTSIHGNFRFAPFIEFLIRKKNDIINATHRMFAQLDARRIDRARRSLPLDCRFYCSHSRIDEATTWNISTKKEKKLTKFAYLSSSIRFILLLWQLVAIQPQAPHTCTVCVYIYSTRYAIIEWHFSLYVTFIGRWQKIKQNTFLPKSPCDLQPSAYQDCHHNKWFG